MLTLQSFSYSLPTDLIAQTPVEPRDSSRLLTLSRQTGRMEHHHFSDLPLVLQPGDVLVRNDTKVFPARLIGQKPTGGKVELLLLEQPKTDEYAWECLTKPGLKLHEQVSFPLSSLTAHCQEVTGRTRLLKFSQSATELLTTLDKIGQTPLPPYISSRASESVKRQENQTTYAQTVGSAAAPTAGLHFTPRLDQQLIDRDIVIETVTLHVGLGTFQSVKSVDITQHPMHHEWFSLSQKTADRLNQAKANQQRIIAVGTTACRVLESCVDESGLVQPLTRETNLYVYPPYQFRFVDGLITNFHLPHSTLLMLVSAFVSHPNTNHKFTSFMKSSAGKAYKEAVQQKYRFFSFGDAMLIR